MITSSPSPWDIEPITLPVPHSTYVQLREAMAKPGEKPFTFGLNVDVHPFLGRFIVVGLREDYALAGNRTYWVTLKWVGLQQGGPVRG